MNTAARSTTEIEATAGQCRVALIGPGGRREFRELIGWLCEHADIRVTDEFADIDTAIQSDRLSDCHLTLVLQSYSDQYTAADINQLIGQTLFQRLLCCYGAWCESDGRNRALCRMLYVSPCVWHNRSSNSNCQALVPKPTRSRPPPREMKFSLTV